MSSLYGAFFTVIIIIIIITIIINLLLFIYLLLLQWSYRFVDGNRTRFSGRYTISISVEF